MLKIGITGGIASGKTMVCSFFESLFQIPIYLADTRAKQIIEENTQVKEKIIQLFGKQAYPNNTYNRKYIASKVFENKSLLKKLNAIVHPAVFADAQDFFIKNANKKYVLYESAIMFSSNSHQLMDKIILVTAPLELRIERAMKRDKLSREEILQRINNQLSDEEMMEKCHFIIYNDGKNDVEKQISRIHQEIVNSSN